MADYCTQACGDLLRASPLKAPLPVSGAQISTVGSVKPSSPHSPAPVSRSAVPDQICVSRDTRPRGASPDLAPTLALPSSPVPARLSSTALYSYPPPILALCTRLPSQCLLKSESAATKKRQSGPKFSSCFSSSPMLSDGSWRETVPGPPAQLSASSSPTGEAQTVRRMCLRVCVHACVYWHMHVCARVHTRARAWACAHMRAYTCARVCVYGACELAYTCAHVHTGARVRAGACELAY